jgi:hypothetical protein
VSSHPGNDQDKKTATLIVLNKAVALYKASERLADQPKRMIGSREQVLSSLMRVLVMYPSG